jgi:glycosyltransferase involved in cell wall biosynthesis
MKRTKIAFVMPSFRVGGAEKRTLALIAGVNRDRFEPVLIVQDAVGDLRRELAPDVPLLDLGTRQMRYVIPRLARALRRVRPDLVFVVLEHTCIAVALAARLARLKVPLVFSVRSNLSRTLASLTKSLRFCYVVSLRLLFPDAAAIVAVSSGAGEDLCKWVPAVKGRVSVLPNAVLTSDNRPYPTHQESPIELVSLNPFLLACGRLAPEKGFDVLLRAYEQLPRKSEVNLVILGEGPERPRLEEMARTLGLQERVHLLGQVRNPFLFMKAARAFVLSSRWEGLPGVLVEAMACGAPCVATNCDFGPADLIENGRNGILVPVDDCEALSKAIERILNDPVRARELGDAAKASVDHYRHDVSCRLHEELFDSLLRRRARGAIA